MNRSRWKEAMRTLAAAQSVMPLGDNAHVYRQLRGEPTVEQSADYALSRLKEAMQNALAPLDFH